MEANAESKPAAKYNASEIAEKLLRGELLLFDKQLRGKAWIVFSRIKDLDGIEIRDYVYCKSCGKVFKFTKMSTSNLVKHKCFAMRCADTEKTNSITEIKKSTAEVDESPTNNLTKLLTRWIITDYRPYNIIRNENLKAVFQELIKAGSKFGSDIDVEKLLPSLSAVAKNVSEIYEQCFEKVKADVASINDNGFGLTSDVWSNNFTERSYIVLTIHYLKNGILTFRLLGLKTLEYEKSTNHQYIAEKINQILEDFECKLSCKTTIVTDEGYNIKSFRDTRNIACISQLLNKVLQKSVEEVPEAKDLISACSKLVNFLKKMAFSPLLDGLFHQVYPKRWLTILKMMKSVESNWNEIEETLQKRNEKSRILSVNIYRLKAVTKTLEPFEDAIESLEEDSYANLHLVIIYLHKLKTSYDINGSEFEDLEFIETLKENIRINLEKIVTENITILHKLSIFLYPPTNKLLQFNDEEKKCVEEECKRLMKCFKNELKPTVKQEHESTITRMSKRRKLFSDFVESEINRDPNELIIEEIQYYKNTRVINSADFDVFGWWELRKNNFPLLYKLSCTVLATPASIAASRRILSSASSLLIDNSRHDSKCIDIEKTMFIKSNAGRDEVDRYFSV